MTSRARKDLTLVILPGIILVGAVAVLLGREVPDAAASPTFSTYVSARQEAPERDITPLVALAPPIQVQQSAGAEVTESGEVADDLHPAEFRLSLVDDQGEPVVGARAIVVARPAFQVNSAANDRDLLGILGTNEYEADEEGVLAFLGESGQAYEVIVEADGYARKRYRLRDPGRRPLQLVRPAAVAGYVYTDEGIPLGGVEVELAHDVDETVTLTTDDDGYYEFRGITPHSATLRVQSPFYEPHRIEHISVEPGNRYIRDFYLRPGGIVSVRVRDPEGTAVADASVELAESSSGLSLGRLQTGPSGEVKFTSLRHGRAYVVTATTESGASARSSFLTPALTDVSDAQLREEQELIVVETWNVGVAVVAGTVPIPSARVVLESESAGPMNSSRHSVSGMTDDEGRVRLTGLLDGVAYTAFVYHPLFATEILGNIAQSAVEDEVVVDLASPVLLEGVVTTDGEVPLANALIMVTLLGPAPGTIGSQFFVRTDRFGRYELPNLPSGEVRFEIFDQVSRRLVSASHLELSDDVVIQRDISTTLGTADSEIPQGSSGKAERGEGGSGKR